MVIEYRISNCLLAPAERHNQKELVRTSGARLRFVFLFSINILPPHFYGAGSAGAKKVLTLFLFLPGWST